MSDLKSLRFGLGVRLVALLLAAIAGLHVSISRAQTASPPRAEQPVVKAGDRWKFDRLDRRTGLRESEVEFVVTAISQDRISGTESGESFVWGTDLTIYESAASKFEEPAKRFLFPLEVGKKWDYKTTSIFKSNGNKGRSQVEVSVVSFEKVRVPAGEFDAFKVETVGFWNNDSNRRSGRIKSVHWYAPAARMAVKFELEDGYNARVDVLTELQLKP